MSLVNSSDVAQRLAQYYACLATFDGDILPGQQLDGNVVGIYDPFDRQMVQACLKSLDIKISGTLKATVSALVGFKPPQVDTPRRWMSASCSPGRELTKSRLGLL